VRLHSSSQEPLVFTGCLDGVVRGWDLRSGQCVKEWHGHSDQILDLAVSRSVLVKHAGIWNEVPCYFSSFSGMTVLFFQLQMMELFECF
jgi:WD40 repeat protein